MNIKLSKGWWLMIVLIASMGCSSKKLTVKVGKGLSDLSPTLDTVGSNFVKSIRTELTSDSSTIQLKHLIDSLLNPVFTGARNTVGSVRDSVINTKTLLWVDSLLEVVTGDHLNKNIMKIQYSFMKKTKADIYEIEKSIDDTINKIVNGLLSDSTREKIDALRDDLLGPKTTNAINVMLDTTLKHIVDSAVTRLALRLRTEIDPLKEDLSFVGRNAAWLLAGLGAIAAIIITLIWFNRRKYLRTVALLTKQIDSIPDKQVYDTVTSKIKSEAITAGLEPTLRGVLKDNGLLSSESWKKNMSQD